MLNDVSAAAWYFSERFDADRFMVVTVSSGLGSKLFDRSRKYGVIDEVDFAGEIGHITIDNGADAMPCDCGGRGHLSAIASGRGVQRYAVQHALEDPASFERSALFERTEGRAESMSNERHLVPAILGGDPWARDVLAHCSYPLAQMLSIVTAAAGLQKIAIIGGFALSLGPAYIEVLNECLEHHKDFELLAPRSTTCCGWTTNLWKNACLERRPMDGEELLPSPRNGHGSRYSRQLDGRNLRLWRCWCPATSLTRDAAPKCI